MSITKDNYTVSDGQVCITKVTRGSGENNDIQLSAIEGYPVTSIADSAFSKSNLGVIIIPEGVTSIGNYAFVYDKKR